jgi:hypothetical protein
MFFVHVIAGENFVGIAFPQFKGPGRVAFGVESIGFDQIGQDKNFTQGPEGQGIFVKRKVLGAVGQTKAKIAEAFKVHRVDSYL